MPGLLLHVGATVLCAHGGQGQATTPNPSVTVGGQPTVLQSAPYTIAGCPFNVSGSPVPCVTASWVTGSVRVTSNGMPLLLIDSQSLCAPNGTPTSNIIIQTRVTGS